MGGAGADSQPMSNGRSTAVPAFGAPIGATPQLVGEMFKRKAGIEFVTIPYKGAANTMTDMLSGQIDMAFEPTSVVLAHISEATTRPIAVTSATRSPSGASLNYPRRISPRS